jgi:hypothetical protein
MNLVEKYIVSYMLPILFGYTFPRRYFDRRVLKTCCGIRAVFE